MSYEFTEDDFELLDDRVIALERDIEEIFKRLEALEKNG